MRSRTWGYGSVPSVYIPRSRQNLSHRVFTSMSVGKLYPVDLIEVLPGDQFSMRQANVSRLTSTFIRPPMGDLYLDVYHFYAPIRILYDKGKEVFASASLTSWQQNERATVPSITGLCSPGTVADYLNIRPGVTYAADSSGNCLSVLPFRMFAQIFNIYYRAQTTVDEMLVQTGEAQPSENLNNKPWSPSNYTGQLPYVRKMADYFVSALPSPQKGEQVSFGLTGVAPVVTQPTELATGAHQPLRWRISDNGLAETINAYLGITPSPDGLGNPTHYSQGEGPTFPSASGSYPSNLGADLSAASAISVNDFRFAVAMQRMLERDAIYGSRYNSYLRAHFDVRVKESLIDFPEYLGGARTPLNNIQVAQTNSFTPSAETSDPPLGTLAAYSWTLGRSRFRRFFPEHGFVMTCACLRYKHMYQQGVPRHFRRFVREDYYDPLFATLGMQPIYQYELFAAGANWDTIFGYGEAYVQYRRLPDAVTGQMRSSSKTSFDVYHFGDEYSSAPVLSEAFTNENPAFVDRTLSVPSTSADSFIFEFAFDCSAVRRMPVSGQPGLVDHH